MADDVERRVNGLFDALNCQTVSAVVMEGLGAMTKGAPMIYLTTEMFTHLPSDTRAGPRAGHGDSF